MSKLFCGNEFWKITIYIELESMLDLSSMTWNDRFVRFFETARRSYDVRIIVNFSVDQDKLVQAEQFLTGVTWLKIAPSEDRYQKIQRDVRGIRLLIGNGYLEAKLTESVCCCSLDFAAAYVGDGRDSFVEVAKKKLLYHELSDKYEMIIDKDTEKECSFLRRVLELHQIEFGKILDCCCGVGRHDKILSRYGYEVNGMDISPDQIDTARINNSSSKVSYQVGDIRSFPVAENQYDGAICMWTSINYLSRKDELQAAFANIAAGLKKDGIFILDVKNFPKPHDNKIYEKVVEDSSLKIKILVIKNIDQNIQCSKYLYFIFDKNREVFDFCVDEEIVRVYSSDELSRYAAPYFTVESLYGGFDLEKYDAFESERLILILKKEQVENG